MPTYSALFFLMLWPALSSAGAIYRWVDAKGQVHYGQAPPQGAAAVAQRSNPNSRAVTRPAAPVSATPPSPSKSAPAAAILSEDITPPAASTSPAEKVKACKTAQERIEHLQSKTPRRILLPQKDGSVARMTDEEFALALTKAEQSAAQACKF